jgi:hypothetical protein
MLLLLLLLLLLLPPPPLFLLLTLPSTVTCSALMTMFGVDTLWIAFPLLAVVPRPMCTNNSATQNTSENTMASIIVLEAGRSIVNDKNNGE